MIAGKTLLWSFMAHAQPSKSVESEQPTYLFGRERANLQAKGERRRRKTRKGNRDEA